MATLTLSGPAEKIKRARVLAAERDTSVSGMFFDYIDSISDTAALSDAELWQREETAMEVGLCRVGPVTWTRDDLHDRGL